MHTRYISSLLRAPGRLSWSGFASRPLCVRRFTCRAIATPDDCNENDDYYGVEDDAFGREAKPDREGDDCKGDDCKGDDEAEPDKFYSIDPGELHYYRATLERLFHSATAPLSGDELKKIMHGRRLQLTMEGHAVILMVYTEPWKNATDDTWNGMAALLSDWSADTLVRELDLAADGGDPVPLFIPLKVRKV